MRINDKGDIRNLFVINELCRMRDQDVRMKKIVCSPKWIHLLPRLW